MNKQALKSIFKFFKKPVQPEAVISPQLKVEIDGNRFMRENQVRLLSLGIDYREDLGSEIVDDGKGIHEVYLDKIRIGSIEMIVKSPKWDIDRAPVPVFARFEYLKKAIQKLQPEKSMGGELYAGET